jgi:hypothetical protein
MILPIVLDTCTIINLLRIDNEDGFLVEKLKDFSFYISDSVYNEVQTNANRKPLSSEQKDYIIKHLSLFGERIIIPDEKIKTEFFDDLKKFCDYNKENGELHSTLLSLYICRKEGSRLFFYTDDFPAKRQFDPYFSYQQLGSIGDSVDLLLFLFWAVTDFKKKQLEKYLRNLYSEYAIPLKCFANEIEQNKDLWLKLMPRDKKLIENLLKIESGFLKLDFDTLNEGIDFFKRNKGRYVDINSVIEKYPDIDTETELTVKIKAVIEKLNSFKICKRLC